PRVTAHTRSDMSAFPTHRTLLVAAITSVLALGSIADAAAQSAAAERRAARQAAQEAKRGEAATEYPLATRKEPGLRPSARMGSRLNKVVSAQQEGDLAAAETA